MMEAAPFGFSGVESLLAFIHIEKTAGETIKWVLRSSFGISHCDISPSEVFKPLLPDQLAKIEKIYPSLQSIAGHPITPYTDLDTAWRPIQYFTFLREPAKQCASYFQYLVSLKRYPVAIFDEWINSEWPRNMQTKRLCGEANAQKAIVMITEKSIFTGLTERFDESVFLFKQFVRPDIYPGYSLRNQARDNALATRLLSDRRTRNLIDDAVSEDIKLYRWVKDKLYPQYVLLYTEKTNMPLPQSFPFKNQNYRPLYLFTNRLYRNLVYKPLERMLIRQEVDHRKTGRRSF